MTSHPRAEPGIFADGAGAPRAEPLLDAFDWGKDERVVVLSPHIDDAALSCGALLRSLRDRVSCLVVTLCCGNPEGYDSGGGGRRRVRQRKGFARPDHRRREDRAAMRQLGCDHVQLGFADAIYRRSPSNQRLIYRQARQKWSRPNVGDASHIEELYLVLRRLCGNMGSIVLLSPMGIGYHVDHTICALTALRLATRDVRLLFYEDFPYVVNRKVGRGDEDDPARALARLSCKPRKRFFVPVDVDAQMETVGCYQSQIAALFGDDERMRSAFGERTHEGQPAEFFWRPAPGLADSSVGS